MKIDIILPRFFLGNVEDSNGILEDNLEDLLKTSDISEMFKKGGF